MVIGHRAVFCRNHELLKALSLTKIIEAIMYGEVEIVSTWPEAFAA